MGKVRENFVRIEQEKAEPCDWGAGLRGKVRLTRTGVYLLVYPKFLWRLEKWITEFKKIHLGL